MFFPSIGVSCRPVLKAIRPRVVSGSLQVSRQLLQHRPTRIINLSVTATQSQTYTMATKTIPTLHYLDIGRMGRGEVVRLFMRDAEIEFNDIRHPYDATWPATSERLKQEGITRTGKVPALLINGIIINQHIAILRYLARDIGRYEGETNHEKFQLDAVSDVYNDWRTQWVANLKGVTDDYKNKFVPQYYDVIAKYYSANNGPYLLGDRISYADFAVYQSIDNDERIGSLPSKLPEAVQKFREAFEARPNIAAYIEENRPKKA